MTAAPVFAVALDPLTLSLSPGGERTPEQPPSLGRGQQPSHPSHKEKASAPSPLGERVGVSGDFPQLHNGRIGCANPQAEAA